MSGLHNEHVSLYYRLLAFLRQRRGMLFASTILAQWAADERAKQA